ncbi:MAG: DUF4352 domain-containing protein [Micromonosporaceae bacterium]|nr:DUF4352 domain-containing protein [Micromonosporaceae bacterium]
METGSRDDTPAVWVGRATPRPPVDPWSTAEQPVVPPHFAPPPQVIYVERPRRRRGCLFTLGVLVALVAGAATLLLLLSPALRGLVGIDSASPPASPSESPSPSSAPPSPTTPPPPPTPGVGDPVRDGKLEFVVLDLSCGAEKLEWSLFTQEADGQFCVVDVNVTNIHDKQVVFPGRGQYAYTADDARVTSAFDANFVANHGHPDLWIIEPGDSITVKLVFDIPVEATISTIELHDSLFSGGVTVSVSEE